MANKIKTAADAIEFDAAVAPAATVPVADVVRTETEPLVEPTAIVPALVYEETAAAAEGAGQAPTMLITKSDRAQRVEVVCDGHLGLKMLKKGDITDDEEYVALLKTERGRKLVRAVN